MPNVTNDESAQNNINKYKMKQSKINKQLKYNENK